MATPIGFQGFALGAISAGSEGLVFLGDPIYSRFKAKNVGTSDIEQFQTVICVGRIGEYLEVAAALGLSSLLGNVDLIPRIDNVYKVGSQGPPKYRWSEINAVLAYLDIIAKSLIPKDDNALTIGDATYRWAQIRAVNAYLGTLKQNLACDPAVTIDGKDLDSSDPFTQYVLRNILTTHGDFFFRDAAGIARLAAGTSGDFLQTKGSGADPVWASAAGFISNLAKGLTPTATGWTTAPTNLGNITDENLTTVTGIGTGQEVTAETNDVNEITIDVGANKEPIYAFAKIGLWTGGGAYAVYALMRCGPDNALTDSQVGNQITTAGQTSEVIYWIGGPITLKANELGPARYLSIRFWKYSTASVRAKVYEIVIVGASVA